MIIDTKTRSQIITSNKDILISKNKDNILQNLINYCRTFLDNAEGSHDFSSRKSALHAWIVGTQNSVNRNGSAEVDFNDKRDYLKHLSISGVDNNFQDELEKLAVHRNAFLGNRKLNFFGEANFTKHMERLLKAVDNMPSKFDRGGGIPLEEIQVNNNANDSNNFHVLVDEPIS